MEQVVTRPEFESLLETIRSQSADPRAGVFGPGSMTWKISREAALFLGAGRAALLQLAHPWVAAAIAEHSTVLGNPIARFHNTFRIVFTVIFGDLGQALAAARSLHRLHTSIRGELPEGVAGWARGSHYEANEVAALRWVHATLIEGAVLAYACVLPLSEAEREQYYQESKTLAALFGIPGSSLPENWMAFAAYSREMAASQELGVSAAARSMGQDILRGAGSWIHPPAWYRVLTAEWLPERFRREFGLAESWTAASRDAVKRARRWLPRFYSALPPAARFVGPYREAMARLRGRQPGVLTRRNSQFWIGQPRMPFHEFRDQEGR